MSDDYAKIQTQLDEQRRKIDVDYFDITLRELIRMAQDDELKRAPIYQRKFRWKTDKESKLIESLFLGLPVPSIFVAANANGTWDLVDGLQRISTLMHFVADPLEMVHSVGRKDPLRLEQLTKLTELNSKTFTELPTPLRLSFYKRSLRVTSLSDKSDKKARFDMFERLNSGGIALSEQEIRSCIYSGHFIRFLRKLGRHEAFTSLLKLQKVHKEDGTAEEVVLKFFAYLHDREEFAGNVKGFLNDYAGKASKEFDYPTNRDLFKDVCNKLAAIVGGPILRQNSKVTPLNQLEALMVGCAELLRANEPIKKPTDGWLDDEQLISFSKAGTNSKPMLEGRINRAKKLLSGKQ